MDKHIRAQLKNKIPSAEVGVSTFTYEEIHDSIIDDYVTAEKMKAKKKQDEADNKKFEHYNR